MNKVTELETENLGYEQISMEDASVAQKKIAEIVNNIETVITGKREKVELVVWCMLAGGHVLIEDIPGVDKFGIFSGKDYRLQL